MPSAIIIPHRLTFGNITTYLHTQLQATWILLSHRLLHAFYTRVPEREGRRRGQLLIQSTVLTTAENLSSDIYRILNPGPLSIQSAKWHESGEGVGEFKLMAIYSNANWKLSYWTNTPKGKIKCQLEIIIACINITFSDQDARHHYLPISQQVSTARHVWKAQHSKIPLDK